MSSDVIPWKILPVTGKPWRIPSEIVRDHPLKNIVVTERIPRRILGSTPSTGRTTPVSAPSNISEPLALALKQLDPLTEFAMHEELDPLSKMIAEMDQTDSVPAISHRKEQKKVCNNTDIWSHRKGGILQKYTTSEKLSMVTSFLLEGEKVVVKAQSTAVDKVQHRLEQLDSFEEGSQRKLDLSQAEYVARIEQLNKELILAWNIEQRVKALKIAIQCSKMLTDTDVLTFYPSKFVLITDILDCFGKLVYERLRVKAEYYKPGSKVPTALPEDFTPDMVSNSAKETCLNWFFKIASIRELVPRLYIEIALLKSYYFISSSDCSEALFRLTETIHGIGNPLVAVYARCYLCRVGLNVSGKSANFNYLRKNFESFLESYQHIFSRGVKEQLHKEKMTLSTYMTLYTPALDFIMETVTLYSPETVLTDLLAKCKRYSNSSLILNTIMSGFKPAYISERCVQFLSMIGQCTDDGIPLAALLRTLGLCISISAPPKEHRAQILNSVHLNMALLQDPNDYISCFEIWIEFVSKYFSAKEVDGFLGSLFRHFDDPDITRKYAAEIQNIAGKIIANISDIESVLALSHFFLLLDLIHEEHRLVDISKTILTKYNATVGETNDMIIANALVCLATNLHDSVTMLTPDDEKRQIGDIICKTIRKIQYGNNFEFQLEFLVEARASFSNLDVVLTDLVQRVNNLAVTTRRMVKGFHTRKSADFVRACAAYCFITIPSIDSPKTRLKLYLFSGQVALFNACLGQADACFKAILSTILELPPNTDTETFLLPYIRQFLSFLLIVPDNPERGVLSILKSLLNTLRNISWNRASIFLGLVYINVIDILSVMAQEVLPYHVDKVESNDALWGSDQKFIEEVNNMVSVVIGELLFLLQELGPCQKQSQIAMDLFTRMAIRSDLRTKELMSLAVKLWNLCLKQGFTDIKYMGRTKNYLISKSFNYDKDYFQRFLDKLVLPQQ